MTADAMAIWSSYLRSRRAAILPTTVKLGIGSAIDCKLRGRGDSNETEGRALQLIAMQSSQARDTTNSSLTYPFSGKLEFKHNRVGTDAA